MGDEEGEKLVSLGVLGAVATDGGEVRDEGEETRVAARRGELSCLEYLRGRPLTDPTGFLMPSAFSIAKRHAARHSAGASPRSHTTVYGSTCRNGVGFGPNPL